MNENHFTQPTRAVLTVSQLTSEIADLLESRFPFIWIAGEISNFRVPASGHYYFSLKDDRSQISGVMFRGQNRNLKFMPEDGMVITGLGRVSVYAPRGSYQVIFEYLEPQGAGALQAAFEQLKIKLRTEGLFDDSRKKPLPFLPACVGVITSGTGAVIHDILNVMGRRFPGIPVEIMPVKVQGEGAEHEIAAALSSANARKTADVLIVARGGGSLEDLSAFNSEIVARAVFASEIPVVSAVGHETDVTIADFVADCRAPTPSAAAELVAPDRNTLKQQVKRLDATLTSHMIKTIAGQRQTLLKTSRRLVHPGRRVQDFRLRTDELSIRLHRIMSGIVQKEREQLAWKVIRLNTGGPKSNLEHLRSRQRQCHQRIIASMQGILAHKQAAFREQAAKLDALSPLNILARGYSITRTLPKRTVVTDASALNTGQMLEILLSKGSFTCHVERILPDGSQTDI